MPVEEQICPVRAVTHGPRAHFFGYYDKPPWDASGRYMLALAAEAVDRMPLPGEKARIGVIDLQSHRFERVAETSAWNWQQGCMLQWLPPAADRQIIYNDTRDGQHVAVILDIHSGRARVLPKPIYNVTRDGRSAVVTSLARLAQARPVVGYAGVSDPWADAPHPADDGVYWMNLGDGSHRLIVSLDQAVRLKPKPSMSGVKHRFEHLVIAPDDKRFLFLQRWPNPTNARRDFYDRLLTVNVDGSELYCLVDDDYVSHFDWQDPQHILVWARQAGHGDHFYLFKDRTTGMQIVGEDALTCDGHCSYSPDRRWLLSDTYPDDSGRRTVLLYELASNRRIDVGRFFSPPAVRSGDVRCDLHPRWRRDGREVCIDSAHEGTRQMYVIDVSAIVA